MDMPPKRPHAMTVTLSDDERDLRDAIVERLGTDATGVMRQAMIDLGLKLGFEFPLNKKKPRPKP
jgi:hypothetical protein